VSEEIIEVRSDVDSFRTVGEALAEALLRADGASVFIHSTDDSQKHNFENGAACFCNPPRIESEKLK
jgi:hypothetical protein